MMILLVSLVFVFPGLVSAWGFGSLGHQVVVKVSHTHKHTHGPDHGDHHQHDQQSEQQQHQSQHTHKIAVSCCHVLFIPVHLPISIDQFSQNQFPTPFDTEAPHACCLDSLFRPPIQA
ncbi:MAG: hypothetical protein IPK68_02820 [Bdellovibrionales bacterium]|nr:hypothetical protein [Bdellovibrionales bacterium]